MQPESSAPPADIALLRKAELFSGLLDDDLNFILSKASVLAMPKGSRLFRPGDKARRVFIVRSGSVRIFRFRSDGGQDEMAVFAAGDVLGDFDFAREAVYDADAEAAEDAELLVFPGEGFSMQNLAKESPDVSARLKLRSLSMLAGRLRATNKLISENAPWVRELRRQAYEDPGTGLWSRAFLDEEVSRSLKIPTGLVLLKPDRFKTLVDERGHAAGDEAMVRIAALLKDETEKLGRGWALRLRSNETALVVPRLDAAATEALAASLRARVAALDPVPAEGAVPAFSFSAASVWASWPEDGSSWSGLFGGAYSRLMELWKLGGDRLERWRDGAAPGAAP